MTSGTKRIFFSSSQLTIYQAGVDAFGEQGMAEIIYLVACFHMIGIILNGYAVAVLGEDDVDESRSVMMQAAH
jgi:hypothetical protein